MKLRLYGGAGHGRMVYLPNSTVTAPPKISVPALPPGQYAKLWPLDPELPNDTVVRYIDTGVDDDDGYRRYEWAPPEKKDHEMTTDTTTRHDYEPSSESEHIMRTDPLCIVCSRRKNDPVHG